MNITTTHLRAPVQPKLAPSSPKAAPQDQAPSDNFSFVEPPPLGYNASSPASLKTSLVAGSTILGTALGVYAGVGTGTAPAIIGGAIGALTGGAAGATAGFFPDLHNHVNGNPTNYTLYLGGIGAVAGAIGGGALGANVSSGLVSAAAGVVAGLGTAFVSSIIAKEAL